jgi:enoyl-CoA hydratase/carnithine racemase
MLNQTYSDNIKQGLLVEWDNVTNFRKPLIAAVNGYAVRSNCALFYYNNHAEGP